MEPSAPVPAPEQPWRLYGALSTPVAVTDEAGTVVFINARAEAAWGLTLAQAAGRPAREVLRVLPRDGDAPLEAWMQEAFHPALVSETPLPCRLLHSSGSSAPALLTGTWMWHDHRRYAVVVALAEGAPRPAAEGLPDWALRDPLTGLHNRHYWQRERARLDAGSGSVIFFDLEDLKALNDLHGHPMGDHALALAGRVLRAAAPPGMVLVRQGGDELIAVLAGTPAQALGFAAQAAAALRALGAAEGLPLPLRLDYGVAEYAAGGLQTAVQRADDALYERKGNLLRAAGGGRIVLTREARGRLLEPGLDPEAARPAAYAAQFGSEFDGYFRQMFARAAAQAREFVDLVAPSPGCAAVEVAAGSGRITFDGGLAQRVGPSGQLLLTDPSAAQLQVARARAHAMGAGWIRFLEAPVEDLPLGGGGADLVLGSTFLHFTDPRAALRSMARVVRPGGLVAVDAPVALAWGDAWLRALEPVRAELAAHGLPLRSFLPDRASVEAAVAAAGLRIERVRAPTTERGEFPDAELAILFCRQIAFVRLMLRGLPEERCAPVQVALERSLREVFPGSTPQERTTLVTTFSLVAYRPAG